MKKTLVAAIIFLSSTSHALAQQTDPAALQIAQAQEACGAGATIVSAQFLENGSVAVRCAPSAEEADADSGGGGGGGVAVSPGVIAGLFTVVLAAFAAGGSSSTSDTR